MIEITVQQARELMKAYDCFAGGMNPDDKEEYLARFNKLRNLLKKLNQIEQEG